MRPVGKRATVFEIILADLGNFLTCTKIEPRANNENHISKDYAPCMWAMRSFLIVLE